MNTSNQLGSQSFNVEGLNDFFLMTDQPATCPKCGARTEMLSEEVVEGIIVQQHLCLNGSCKYSFKLYEE